MADTKKALDVVRNLIETCRDGQSGFSDAAKHVKDPSLRELFNALSLERAQFASELQSALVRLGEDGVEQTGSVSGSLHRAWIDLKANLGGGDASILASAESGEDTAKKVYQEAERENLPEEIRTIVSRQAQSVLAAHDRVRTLRDQQKAA